jgi:hypothetical protein
MRLKLIAAAIFLLVAAYWIVTHSFLIIGTGTAMFAALAVALYITFKRRK